MPEGRRPHRSQHFSAKRADSTPHLAELWRYESSRDPLQALFLANRRTHLVPVRMTLKQPRCCDYHVIVERASDKLHPERKFFLTQAARHADRRQSAQTRN